MLYLAPLFFQKKTPTWTAIPTGPAVEIIPEHSKHVESYSCIASGTPAPILLRKEDGGSLCSLRLAHSQEWNHEYSDLGGSC